MNGRRIAASMAVVVAATAVMPITAEASTNIDLRKKVIGISGIMSVTNMDSAITRGEFASMLVNASSYRSTVSSVSNTSVFADVPRDHTYAASIRIAAEPGSIKSESQLIGTPPMEPKQYFKAAVVHKNLPELQQELRNLRKELEELKQQLINK